MSPATKGKALLALLLFLGLLAAVTLVSGRNSDAPRDGRGDGLGDGDPPAAQGEPRKPGPPPADEPADPTPAATQAPSDDSVGHADEEAATPAAGTPRTPPADPGDGAWPVSDARPAPDPGSGGLSAVERGRAEQAASQFVVYAYGYTGEDVEQYRSYVNQAVVPESFAGSPGAAHVEDFARKVEATGTESSVIPQSVEVRPGDRPGEAEARVTFELTDPSGRTLISQDSRAVALGDVWRVAYAGELEAVGE